MGKRRQTCRRTDAHPFSQACSTHQDMKGLSLLQEQHSHQEIAEEILKLDPATQER